MLKITWLMVALIAIISACQVDKNKERTIANVNKVLNAVNKNKLDNSTSVVKVLTDDIFFNELVDIEESKSSKTLKIKDNTMPLVIDFYADWCGPCVKAKPFYENLAKQYQHRVVFYRINVDKNNETFVLLSRLVKDNGGIPFFIFINTKDQVDHLSGWNSDVSPRLFAEKLAWLIE